MPATANRKDHPLKTQKKAPGLKFSEEVSF